MFSPYEPLLRFRRTGGSIAPNGLFLQYVRWGKIWGLFFLLLLAFYSSASFAQPKEIPPSENLDPEKYRVWRNLHQRANDALEGGRKVDAIAAWKAAFEIKPAYYLACDLGSAEGMAGNPVNAAEYLSICLRDMPNPPSDADIARKPELEKSLKKAKAQIGTIQLEVLEIGASVSIDGKLKGVSPISDVFVLPGLHSLVIEKKGYQREEREISIEMGQAQTIIVPLKEIPSPKLSRPPTEIEAEKPLKKPTVKPEQRPAKAEKKAGKPSVSTKPYSVRLIKAGFGIAGIGFGFGTAMLVASQDWSAKSDAAGAVLGGTHGYNCVKGYSTDACLIYQRAEEKRAQMLNGAIISYSLAGAVALSTVVYIVVPRKGFDLSIGPQSAMVKIPW